MKPNICNLKEMGLVPGSWAWMKHQLENATIEYSVMPDNLPVFKAKFPNVASPFVCFAPGFTYDAGLWRYSTKDDCFSCAKLVMDKNSTDGIIPYASKAAKQLFEETLAQWATDFAELIE